MIGGGTVIGIGTVIGGGDAIGTVIESVVVSDIMIVIESVIANDIMIVIGSVIEIMMGNNVLGGTETESMIRIATAIFMITLDGTMTTHEAKIGTIETTKAIRTPGTKTAIVTITGKWTPNRKSLEPVIYDLKTGYEGPLCPCKALYQIAMQTWILLPRIQCGW